MNYCEVTVQGSTKEVFEAQLMALSDLEMVYDYPSLSDQEQVKIEVNENSKQNLESLINANSYVRVHYDFTNALDFHRKSSKGIIGFGFVKRPKIETKGSYTPYLAQQIPPQMVGMATVSPYADGFSINNIGPKADWTLFEFPQISLWDFTLTSGGQISAPYLPPLENRIYGIVGADIYSPYQNVFAAGFWYYQ